MSFFRKLHPRVSKRVLLLISGTVWGFASSKILLIAIASINNTENLLRYYLTGFIMFIPFFYFILRKVVNRYSERIFSFTDERVSIFRCFDVKGYLLMIFMITLGITARRLPFIPPLYLGTVYFAIGLSLGTAALYFLYKMIFTNK